MVNLHFLNQSEAAFACLCKPAIAYLGLRFTVKNMVSSAVSYNGYVIC